MTVSGTSSGTQDFFLSNSEILFESFDRIMVRPSEITVHHLVSGRRSMNLELQAWSNLGINLWEVVQAQLTLVAEQATYTLPANLVTIMEMYFTTVNGDGTGRNSDRIMVPLTRTQYAQVPNKLQPGLPTQYWLERLEAPVVTIWQPAFQGSPAYIINYNYLQRIDDAGIGAGQTPDIPYRAMDALCAGLAKRLAKKFAPPQMRQQIVQETMADATEAWNNFVTNDLEDGPLIMQPNVGGYARMRR
jgi:hypothetical protein